MKYEQVAKFVNEAYKMTTGTEDINILDTSSVVDVGKELLDGSHNQFLPNLVSLIMGQIIVDRTLDKGYNKIDILRREYEYGSILEKITLDIPEAEDDPRFTLKDGDSVDQYKIKLAKATAKFFENSVAKQITQTIFTDRLKDAFMNENRLNAFISAIYTQIYNRIVIDDVNLTMSVITNHIGAVLNHDIPDKDYKNNSTARAVNLLKSYNEQFGTDLKPEKALTTPEFLRYSALVMTNYISYMQAPSVIYNISGKMKFTPKDLLHIVLLSDFKNAFTMYLESDTYHKELISLPKSESIVQWQGSGTAEENDSISKSVLERSTIKVKANIGNNKTEDIEITGVLGVMFDHEADGIYNAQEKITSSYNANGDYTNYFYKYRKSFFNDFAENFVVFFIA